MNNKENIFEAELRSQIRKMIEEIHMIEEENKKKKPSSGLTKKQKSGSILKEALNKDIRVFADSIWKALAAAGFTVEGSVNQNLDVRNIQERVENDPKLIYLKAYVTSSYESLEIWGNKKAESKVNAICSKFQTTPYSGKEFQINPTTIKQVVGAFNPGDIYHFPKNQSRGNSFLKGYARQAKTGAKTQTTNTGIGTNKQPLQ